MTVPPKRRKHIKAERGKPVDRWCDHKPKCQSWREHRDKVRK